MLMALGLVLLADGAVAAPQQAKAPVISADTRAAASAISRLRKGSDLPPVRGDALLEAVARRQATAMARADRLSHDVDGAFARRMDASGIGLGASAENLGVGYGDLADVIAGWMASPGHRDNLLKPPMRRVGLARAANAKGVLYWALVLASEDERPLPVMGGPGAGPVTGAAPRQPAKPGASRAR